MPNKSYTYRMRTVYYHIKVSDMDHIPHPNPFVMQHRPPTHFDHTAGFKGARDRIW